MKYLGSLLLLTLVSQVLAAEVTDAVDLLYFYSVYELDHKVHSPGKGVVANDCKGSLDAGKCTFNEFVSHLTDGAISNLPRQLEPEAWVASPSTVGGFVVILYDIIHNKPFSSAYKMVNGRKTNIGIWNDLGFAVENARVVGAAKKINIERFNTNTRTILRAVYDYRTVAASTRLRTYLSTNVKDVVWQTVQNRDMWRPSDWQQVNWDETVKRNPDMANPKSDLFKEVTYHLEQHLKKQGEIQAKSINFKLGQSIHIC